MKKDYDEFMNKIQNKRYPAFPFSNDEIRSIVETGSKGLKQSSKLNRGITMTSIITSILMLGIFGINYLSNDPQPATVNKEIAKTSLGKSSNVSKSTTSTEVKENKSLGYEEENKNNEETNKASVTIIKLVQDNGKKIYKQPETLPWNIKGLTVFELTDEEFEKLVPNSRINDTTFCIYQEYLAASKEDFDRFKLNESGYNESDLPLAFITESTINTYRFRSDFKKIKIYNTADYMKKLYVAYSTSSDILHPGHSMYNIGKSVLLDSSNIPFFIEYAKFSRNLSKNIYYAYKAKDTTEVNRIHIKTREYDNKMFESLIPVKMKVTPNQNMIFWFYPNEEFLSSMPKRYSDDLRHELEIKKKFEAKEITLAEACKGLETQESVFGLCRLSEGAIKFDNLYPNPDEQLTKLIFILSQNRNVSISLFNVNGNLVKEITKNQPFDTGTHEVNISLDKLPIDIYMIIVRTNENETIVKRLIKL